MGDVKPSFPDVEQRTDVRQQLPLYYRNQMNPNYKIDESIIKRIVRKEISVLDAVKNKLSLFIYYKSLKLFNLVIKNNRGNNNDSLHQSHVVYLFKCSMPHFKVDEYIGHTTTTLSRRLTMHLQSGSILDHFRYAHQKKLTRPILEEGTSIVAIELILLG